MNETTAFVFMFFLVFIPVALAIPVAMNTNRRIKIIAERHLNLIYTQHPELTSGEYAFYTNNHPYVWGEIPESELKARIEESALGLGGGIVDPPRYCCKVDHVDKRFYIVPRRKSFDFTSLMHYDKWQENQKEVAKVIQQHRASKRDPQQRD